MEKSVELKALGKKVRKKRLKSGLTQTELAYRVDKDRPSISRLEAGNVNPTYIYLLEIAEGLEISISDLLE